VSVVEGSQWNAKLYDDKHAFVWKMAAGLLDLLEAKPGERILDLGCGTGHLASQIAASGATVVGVDRSPEMIQQAREKHPNLQFDVMDARDIAFLEPFDAIFSNATLHWITEPEKVVAGIVKSLKPGGRFVAEFGGKGNVVALMVAIEHAWHKLDLPGPAANPWYYPSVAEYAGLLDKYGLEVTYATLFERPTPLEDGELGLRNWLKMFGGVFIEKLTPDQRDQALQAVEKEARPTLFHAGKWVLDYRRLRLVAQRTRSSDPPATATALVPL
jgi:trans-aconitate methyltransferase